ncbi:MAG: hypothetical protein Q9O62_06880 [Ardenticatenia bacterium]|nr:hypothetical protein [Ardenticatenia bacterium]
MGWLIGRWGVERVKWLYGRADQPEKATGLTYAQLEQRWLRWLSARPVDPLTVRRFGLKVQAFEAMRRYQTTFDPFARVLPEPPDTWPPTLVLKYGEIPDGPAQVALETLIKALQGDLRCGRLGSARRRLEELRASLEAGTVVGPEAEARLALAERLDQIRRTLQTAPSPGNQHHQSLPTPLLTLWEQEFGSPVRQEVAAILVTPGAGKAVSFVWWFALEGETAVPIAAYFARNGDQWSFVAAERRRGGNTLCARWPMVSIGGPVSALSTSAL